MKKVFFYAALAAVALTSCSKHDDDVVNKGNDDDSKQAIRFVMGSPIEITTRGTGAVGDIQDGANYWAGEELNVFMFDRGLETLKITKNETTGTDYFNDAAITAPTAEKGQNAGTATYGNLQYYPGSGEYEFFAYRADDAAVKDELTGKNVITKLPSEDAPTAYTVAVNIDGTQDLMFAKAIMNAEDSAKLEPATMHRVYSSYAARRDIHPRFKFEHLLSRLVFNVEAAEGAGRPTSEDINIMTPEEEYRGVWIDSIKILDVHNNGTMTVAYIGEKPQNIVTWNTDITDTLSLKDRDNAGEEAFELEPFQPMYGKSLRVGESMLLPESESYELMVFYSQYPSDETYEDDLKAKFTYSKTLEPAGGFQPGMQYNVNIKVYGAEEIQLELELTPWNEGEDIPVDSEDEENH